MSARRMRDLFDRNAGAYDRVNSITSLRLDGRWRRWVAKKAVDHPGVRVLDAFSGTGGVGLEAAGLGAHVTLADISPRMLAIARRKAFDLDRPVGVECLDLTAGVPAGVRSFDAITLSFGLRYLETPVRAIKNLTSGLKPGGKLIALEFVVPEPGPFSSPASFYFFNVLPKIGARLAGRPELHDYLVASVKAFGGAENMRRIVESAGLVVIEQTFMGFGLVCGMVGEKPPAGR